MSDVCDSLENVGLMIKSFYEKSSYATVEVLPRPTKSILGFKESSES